ncbi:hypothetical protein VB796_22790 [Arcicella sp. LKC2W]|uniref:hypothetical protein n=1 Tax=Arcicella sp. LKC2W TaxID=2984198 RepID=UPI002B1FDF1C|nr:hypothetical protein [Arcicella sp. LKC2W]MEA5461915.1 hypothetical protein [Arcicella sp. LKC2W]
MKRDIRDIIQAKAKTTVTNNLLSDEGIKKNIIILPILKDLIRPLENDEIEQLKNNIIANGCQDSLKIWQTTQKVVNANALTNEEQFVLIDGHNRYKICSENNIPFAVSIMKFQTLDDVISWMIDLQLGRRNMSPNEIAYYRGLKYNQEKKIEKTDNFSSTGTSLKTSQKLAQQYGINEKTIRRDAEFSKGVESLSPELKREFLNGKVKVSKKDLEELGKIGVVEKIETVEAITTYINPKEIEVTTKQSKAESVRAKIKNAQYLDITVSIRGKFLLENGLVDIWKDLRNFPADTLIDDAFEDSVSIYQAQILGLIKEI